MNLNSPADIIKAATGYEDLDVPPANQSGAFERVLGPENREVAVAANILVNNGEWDDAWDTIAGQVHRVGAYLLETDSDGFHTLDRYVSEQEAEAEGEKRHKDHLSALADEDEWTRPNDLTALSDIDVENLSALSLSVESIEYEFDGENWAELRGSGGYIFSEPCECEECNVIVLCSGGSVECPNENCPMYEQTISEDCGPMMNYYYPLHRELSEDEIMNLINLPLVYVEVDDNPGLALSGGGMDLSWEVCEAFIRLGFLPPSNFAALPAMCGRGGSTSDKVILAACRRTAQAVYEAGEQRRTSILASAQECESLAAERGERE